MVMISMKTKVCKICKKEKQISEFPKTGYKNSVRAECKICYNNIRKLYYSNNREKMLLRAQRNFHSGGREKQIENRKKQKLLVYEKYGNKCVCCGEKEIEFLSMDHVNGNGNEHRRSISKSAKILPYSWIIKNKFPSILQILCMNCNFAKGKLGYCPHEK